MATLYEIADSLANTMEYEVDVETGECLSEEELKVKLDELNMTMSEKIDNIGKFIKNLESDVEAFKSEQKKLLARRKTTENKLSGLKKYIDDFLKLQCRKEDGTLDVDALKKLSKQVSTPSCGYGYRSSSSVSIKDFSKIPTEFIKDRKLDEDDIKKTDVGNFIKAYIAEHKTEENPHPEKDIDYAEIVTNINLSIK